MTMKVSALSLHISEKKWSLRETNSYREEFRLTFHCQLILFLSKSFQQRKHCYLCGKGKRYWHVYMLTNLNNLIPKFCKINLKHANTQEFSSFSNDKIILNIKQKLLCSLVSAVLAYSTYVIKLSVIFSYFKYFLILFITEQPEYFVNNIQFSTALWVLVIIFSLILFFWPLNRSLHRNVYTYSLIYWKDTFICVQKHSGHDIGQASTLVGGVMSLNFGGPSRFFHLALTHPLNFKTFTFRLR